MDDEDLPSEHTRGVALPMAFLLGVFGGHRFYVGRTGTGLLMLSTLGGLGLWWLYDLILITAGEFRDADGRRVIRWSADSPMGRETALPPGSETLREDLEIMRAEMGELAERVDFMERMLASARERDRLPPPPA